MRILPLLLSTLLISCQTNQAKNNNPGITNPSSTKTSIPAFLKEYLTGKLPGWELASKDNWENNMFESYNTDSAHINYILTDFNCDNKTDFAGILKDSTGSFSSFEIYSIGEYYISQKLETYGHIKKLEIGFRYLKSKIPTEISPGFSETFECGAIERFNMKNKARKIFYSNKKGFFEIVIGDE